MGSSSDTTLSWTVLLTIGGALLWTKCEFNVKPTALDVGSMNNILALTYTRSVSDHPDTKKNLIENMKETASLIPMRQWSKTNGVLVKILQK